MYRIIWITGGTILFDTREEVSTIDPARGGDNTAALARITSGLNIPALTPVHDDHVIGKSFLFAHGVSGALYGRHIMGGKQERKWP